MKFPSVVAYLVLLFGCGDGAFLLVSSPTEKAVLYSRLPTVAETARGMEMTTATLLSEGDVQKPMGLAVDPFRKILYVADPGLSAVLAMHIFEHSFPATHITVGAPLALFADVAVHWVAVDSLGTLFCSDAENGRIFSMAATDVAARLNGVDVPRPQDLYSAVASDPISSPQGLAADGFHLFWVNGEPGQGAVVRALEDSPYGGGDHGGVIQLADNIDEAFGICVTSSRVFYTARTANLYSVPLEGGEPVVVSDSLQQPRGCAFDGDGTVYVADAQGNVIYSLAGGSFRMGSRRLTTALQIPGAYGVAVMTSSSAVLRATHMLLVWLVAASALLY